MKQKPAIHYSLMGITLILLIVCCVNSVQIITALTSTNDKNAEQGQEIKLKGFELVDKALQTKTKAYTFTFKGSFDSPFRKISGVTRRKGGGGKQKPVYKKLFLKGTLIKDNALAIIEDEDGKTFICKAGDRVHNRLVARIKPDMVTIRDNGGTTVLKVKER